MEEPTYASAPVKKQGVCPAGVKEAKRDAFIDILTQMDAKIFLRGWTGRGQRGSALLKAFYYLPLDVANFHTLHL